MIAISGRFRTSLVASVLKQPLPASAFVTPPPFAVHGTAMRITASLVDGLQRTSEKDENIGVSRVQVFQVFRNRSGRLALYHVELDSFQ